MAIATENEDQKLVWFIWGRLTYNTLDFEPIEDAPLIPDSVLDTVIKALKTV